MQSNKRHKLIENTIYTTLWLLVLFVIIFLSQKNNEIQWNKVLLDTITIAPFLLMFLANNMWLASKFLFKKKYFWYFGITAVLIVGISHPKVTVFIHELLSTNKAISVTDTNIPLPRNGVSPLNRPPRSTNLEQLRPGMEPQARGQFIRYLNNILLSILVIGFNTAIKQGGRLIKEERLRHQISEEKLQAELAFLKHQISPHFLMNTLNNIHALVEIEPKDAQSSIVKLSHMLRYLLYEKEDKKTSLAKEIDFIKSYAKLMQMRYTEELDVQLNIPDKIPPVSIPPFVFMTILENAFKHGAATQKKCYIHLNVSIEDKWLVVMCKNCKKTNTSLSKPKSSGIGLENTRKRLDLYYGDNYIWDINDNENTYTSTIKLPIYDD
ncbi:MULTISPECIES: sensor histidine kinase [unclassified Saccharicrinis]|uniref:sensor histidine kinase n=1 Tax=unclassified Saccharicrinis TaxID=2646859 RepID=UPI003D33F1F5